VVFILGSSSFAKASAVANGRVAQSPGLASDFPLLACCDRGPVALQSGNFDLGNTPNAMADGMEDKGARPEATGDGTPDENPRNPEVGIRRFPDGASQSE